jgi:hypothetical protein
VQRSATRGCDSRRCMRGEVSVPGRRKTHITRRSACRPTPTWAFPRSSLARRAEIQIRSGRRCAGRRQPADLTRPRPRPQRMGARSMFRPRHRGVGVSRPHRGAWADRQRGRECVGGFDCDERGAARARRGAREGGRVQAARRRLRARKGAIGLAQVGFAHAGHPRADPRAGPGARRRAYS